MAYFPASCDNDCKECSQNKCGWCAFHDCPVITTAATNYCDDLKAIVYKEDKQ